MSFFKPSPRFRIYTSVSSFLAVLKDIILMRTTTGRACEALEKEMQKRFIIDYSLCVPQGRVGIYLAVKALIHTGQEVILSPYTIADVINMVICAGGIPVFADIERETCNINPSEIEKLINKNTGAVMITHLHGLACNMDRIVEICKISNVPLIEDAAQAFSAKYNGKTVGTFGDIGVYSFGMYKNLTSFYGGIIVTPHNHIYNKICEERNTFPFSEINWFLKKFMKGLFTTIVTSTPLFQLLVYRIFRFGHLHNIRFINRFVETELDLTVKDKIPDNYLRKMTPMQARLVLSKINNVQKTNLIRIKFAQIYHDGLINLPKITLPPFRTDGSHIYTYFPIQYSNRKVLVRWLMKHHADIGIQHLNNTADLPAFQSYFRNCPIARETANEVILLPTYPSYGENMVKRNIKIIRSFFET